MRYVVSMAGCMVDMAMPVAYWSNLVDSLSPFMAGVSQNVSVRRRLLR